MLRRIVLTGLLTCLSLGLRGNLYAQENVYRAWGKSIGTAQTDRDFLIYDAVCANNKLFIVGKAENGTDFELKQRENTYFHGKDSTTDAFLACMSLEGELLWSTYLPALEDGYYNAFATTVGITDSNTIVVFGNTYKIQESLAHTQSLVPYCFGKVFLFEFDTTGKPLVEKNFKLQYRLPYYDYPEALTMPPRIEKFVAQQNVSTHEYFVVGGVALWNIFHEDYHSNERQYIYSTPFLASIFPDWQENELFNYSYTDSWIHHTYIACYMVHPNFWNIIDRYTENQKESLFTGYLDFHTFVNDAKSTDTAYPRGLYARGINLLENPGIYETWNVASSENTGITQYYAHPSATSNEEKQTLFPGSVQNIHTFNGKYLVQGIHCRNYDNGFFKKDGEPYAYSHDTAHLIPKIGGFYQKRNNSHTAVPYLMLYDSATLFGTTVSEEDSRIYDYQTPLWGSYLNVDWFYEDLFHVTDSGQKKDIYQPYEAILCSSGDRFFLIGNAKTIGNDIIDNASVTDAEKHHQGVILAFSINCPPETTAFEDVRFLCPDDSVELKLSPDYASFKFRFDPACLADGSIVLNADSSRAWAKKEGTFTATLSGSAFGCSDVTVDTVRISFSPYPEPVSALNPDSTIAACAAVGVVLNAVTETDTSFAYRWFDGDSVNPKTVRFNNDSLFFASVEVIGYCTSFRDSTQIRFLPPYVNLGKDSVLCTDASQTFADTTILLHLSARQNYFPDADWIFRWKINGVDASDSDSQPLRYADLEDISISFSTAVITIDVSLSDASAEACTAHDTLVFSLVSLPAPSPNRFLPQSDTLCAHQDLDLLLPEIANEYRGFWLDQDSVLLPYGYDTNRFTVTGMRGTDGFGANTDTRNPRFFQLRLDHKLCGVSYFDTLLVYDQVKPVFELTCHDTVICLNEAVELDTLSPLVYYPFYGFEWNDGTKGSGYSFSDSGTYLLKFFVKEGFAVCGYDTASDTIYVRWSDPAQTLITLEDTSFCENLSVVLDATVPFPTTRYSWQEGSLDDLFSPLDDTTLFTPPILKVDKSVSLALFVVDTMNCVNTKQIAVTEEDCKPNLSIPNVFTPNGDGVNDVLKFKQIEYCYDVDILIVDRKGSHVLHQKLKNPDDFAWNGCMKNGSRKLPDGAYFYFISYRNAYGKKKYQSGSITILGARE